MSPTWHLRPSSRLGKRSSRLLGHNVGDGHEDVGSSIIEVYRQASRPTPDAPEKATS